MSRLRWLVSITVAVLLLGGCSGDEPAAGPRPASSPPGTTPVTTTSPTPAPPELPARAQKNTKAGAVAFVYHYIDLINFSATSGETRALRVASQPTCRGCTGLLRGIRQIYAHEGWIRTTGWKPRGWTATGQAVGDEHVLAVRVAMPTEKRKAGPSADVTTSEAGRGTVNFRVQYRARGWTVAEMGLM